MLVLDRDLRCVYVNERALQRLGRSREAIITASESSRPDDFDSVLSDACAKAVAGDVAVTVEGSTRPFGGRSEVEVWPFSGGVVVVARDVSERRRVEEELARSERRYDLLGRALKTVVWQTDADGRPTRPLDWPAVTGRPAGPRGEPGWRELIHLEDVERVGTAWRRALEDAAEFDEAFRVRHAEGRWLHVRVHGVPVLEDGRVEEWIGVVDDLTDRVAAEEALRRAATEDPLTGLPNRTVFLERLRAVLARRRHCAAVLYVDVDEFKGVNDRFGHATGDALLLEVAARLRATVRPSDFVSRLSGDEFAVICDGLGSDDEAATIAARVCSALASPLGSDERVDLSASIGVALISAEAEEDAEPVMRAADEAMYRAKARGGRRFEVFDQPLRERLHQRTIIEAELRAGLHDGALALRYQPIVPLDGDLPCVESLLRWQRPGGPAITAQDAISIAEATGLIAPIGRAVLARACREAASWDLDVRVAVNVSARQLARADELLEDVHEALDGSGLAPERLTLEITETVLMNDMLKGETVIARLRALGIKLEIDDFGVGYSSLSYLHRLPVQALKLDRSFIAGLPDDTASARVLDAVVGLASAFEIRVIAEGVETVAQLDAVREAGCDAVQGFLLARPVASLELPGQLTSAVATAGVR